MSLVTHARADPPALPLAIRRWLDRAATIRDGEIVVETSRGVGRIFLSRGRVAWVIADQPGERLSTALMRRTNISRATLRDTFEDCRRTGSNFAEELVRRGAVDRLTLHEVLRDHNAQQLAAFARPSATLRVLFEPTARRYASDFLFTVEELLPDERATRPDEPTRHAVSLEVQEIHPMANINASLEDIMALDGAIAAALVDWESGLTLGTLGGNASFDIELAASGNTAVVKAKARVMRDLGIQGGIEDILITLDTQYHLVRPLTKNPSLFLYVAIDKAKGNLGLARHKLRAIEEGLSL